MMITKSPEQKLRPWMYAVLRHALSVLEDIEEVPFLTRVLACQRVVLG
jgi:hypothetical protein